MNVEELFQGIAVIFDDELNDSKSTISRIKARIQEKNIPVAVYTEVPQPEIIPSLSSASIGIIIIALMSRAVTVYQLAMN